MAYRAQLMNSPRLDREARPPWRFYILDDGKAMVVQTHHALGDGSSLLQMLVDLCGSESSVVMPISSRVNNSSKWSLVSVLRFLYLCMTAFYHCVIFPVVGRDDTQTQIQRLDLAAESRVHIVAMELPLSSLKMHGYSVNDILTAAIVGALRRYLDSFPEHPSVNTSSPTSSSFHALMPINLRGLSASKRIQEGNKISILTVPCPIDKGSVGGRLADVARTMRDLKASPEAHMNLWINTQAFKWFSRAYMLQKAKELYRHASFCFSNVPGGCEFWKFSIA
jgi:hypothetical protein